MRLSEIKPLTEAAKTVAQLEQELGDARSKYSAFRRDNSIKSKSEVPHHLQNKFRGFVDKIAAINEQIKIAKENAQDSGDKSTTKDFNQKLASRHDDKEASDARKGKALSAGSGAAKAWVEKQGGYAGAGKEMERIAKEQTNDGQEPFDAQEIADKIGITKGSVLRWINTRKEFYGVKKYK